MGRVTCVTFSYTFIHALLYLMCKGWSTTTTTVNRNQATNLTMVMGIIYLMYSAYFLSSDLQGMVELINIILALVYTLLSWTNIMSLNQQIQLVEYLIVNTESDMPASF